MSKVVSANEEFVELCSDPFNPATEILVEWSNLNEQEQDEIIKVHAVRLSPRKVSLLRTIFSLGQPSLVIGKSSSGCYCRVSADSVPIIKLLIREYL